MKKVVILLILIVFLFVNLSSQSIKVNSPKSGDVWEKGKACQITWAHFGKMDLKVKINIFRNSISQSNFVLQIIAFNNGSKSWIIPKSFATGIYQLRIKTAGGKVVYGDSNKFKIVDQGKSQKSLSIDPNLLNNRTVVGRFPQINNKMFLIKPVIGVYEPKQGVVLSQNQVTDIKWKFSGVMSNMVKIYAVYQNTGALYTIAFNTANDGHFSWNLGKATWNPGKYVVRVQSLNGAVRGNSKIFSISAPSSSPGLTKLRNDFLGLINNYRKSKGLNILVLDTCLNNAAQGHSEWMKSTGKFDHTGKNGSSPWSRCSSGGCSCDAENIHYGSSSASGCFISWKNSPGHNANMLGSHTNMGIGISGGYWTAVFK